MLKQRILQDLRAWRPPLNNSKNHRVGVIGLVTTPVLALQEGHPDAHHGCFYKSRLGAHLSKLVGEENFDPRHWVLAHGRTQCTRTRAGPEAQAYRR